MGRWVWGAWIVFAAFAAAPLFDALVFTTPRELLRSHAPPDPMPPPARSPRRVGPQPAPPPADFSSSPLAFLSTAPPDSLMLLPGIGPVLAARIVDARSGQRAFVSWVDLQNRVSGIGEKSVARLRKLADAAARQEDLPADRR